MKFLPGLLLILLSSQQPALASEGMVSIESHYSASETADRLVDVLKDKGMKVFLVIDHQLGASSVNIELNETKLVIFGNPKVGAPLMACQQSVAIDLPQKALITTDANGKVWISYNDPAFLKHRHNINGCDQVLGKASKALGKFVAAAAGAL